MRRVITALGLVATLTALAACNAGTDDDKDGEAAPAGADRDCAAELDEGFGAWAEAGFSGSVAIATGGEFDCRAAYGAADREAGTPNTTDTVFSIGSVSKSFTAAAVLQLIDEGTLSLDDRAGALVPGLGGPAAEATVEQLLMHTSGLTGSHGQDHQPLSEEEAIVGISGLEREFEPGSGYLYSNSGYTLLALIVEEVREEGYREFMASEVLPLPDGTVAGGFWDGEPAAPGPRALGYGDDGPSQARGDFPGPHWALSGNGDLAMTMEQLALWTDALFTGEVVTGGSAELLRTPGFTHEDGTGEVPGWAALDETVYGTPLFTASGGGGDIGHDTVVIWLPETEQVMAVASNTTEITAGDLMRAVGPALAAGEPLPRPDAPDAEADPAELAAAEGRYQLAGEDSFEVTAQADGLTVAASGPAAIAALFPPSGGFTTEDLAVHEEAVRALLAGESAAGREERELLESDLGTIESVAVEGTVVRDGELRTFVTVVAGTGPILLWYALDEHGGIAGAEGPTDPPALRLVPAGDGSYRPDDPAGTGAELTVAFEDGRMTVSGPSGSVTGFR